jgi:Fe-S-cluster-containing dehydrogenase component
VVGDAHHFRTWVERYVYLEGEDKARVDSHADPLNIAASGSEAEYRFDNRYKDAKVSKAFFIPKMCNHCTHPACVQVCPVGATFRTEDGVVLIDHDYCIGCFCVQAAHVAHGFHQKCLRQMRGAITRTRIATSTSSRPPKRGFLAI